LPGGEVLLLQSSAEPGRCGYQDAHVKRNLKATGTWEKSQ
jgi:hypothetical protein